MARLPRRVTPTDAPRIIFRSRPTRARQAAEKIDFPPVVDQRAGYSSTSIRTASSTSARSTSGGSSASVIRIGGSVAGVKVAVASSVVFWSVMLNPVPATGAGCIKNRATAEITGTVRCTGRFRS